MKKKRLLIFVMVLSFILLSLDSCCFYPFPYWDYDESHGYHRHQHQEHHEGGGRRGESEDQKIEKVKEISTKEEK